MERGGGGDRERRGRRQRAEGEETERGGGGDRERRGRRQRGEGEETGRPTVNDLDGSAGVRRCASY